MTPVITLVLARADNGVIGKDNALPWRIPADLKRFKAMTMGKPMIMGRKTFESLGGPLPGRRHIVMSRLRNWRPEGVEVANSPEKALKLARQADEVSVIGGAEIFRKLERHAQRIALTEVHFEPEGDTMIEAFDPAVWREVSREDRPADGDTPAHSFVTLERR